MITRIQEPSYHLHPLNFKWNPTTWLSLEDCFPRCSMTFLDFPGFPTSSYWIWPSCVPLRAIPSAAWASRSQQCHLRLLNCNPAPGAKAIGGRRMVNAHDGNPPRLPLRTPQLKHEMKPAEVHLGFMYGIAYSLRIYLGLGSFGSYHWSKCWYIFHIHGAICVR